MFDYLSKYALFLPLAYPYTATSAAQAFPEGVVLESTTFIQLSTRGCCISPSSRLQAMHSDDVTLGAASSQRRAQWELHPFDIISSAVFIEDLSGCARKGPRFRCCGRVTHSPSIGFRQSPLTNSPKCHGIDRARSPQFSRDCCW